MELRFGYQVCLSLIAAAACTDSPISPPQYVVNGSITLPRDYAVPWQNYEEFIRAISEQARSMPALACEDAQSRLARIGDVAYTGDVRELGAIHTYGAYTYLNTTFLSLFARVPGRYFECYGLGGGAGWIYGWYDDIDLEHIDAGYGTEEEDSPPGSPPEGMSAEEYGSLNPAEKRLVWEMFQEMGAELWAATMLLMSDIRNDALAKAAATGLPGAEDGPQDGWRHTYWQCRLARGIGQEWARKWGDAHEKYAPLHKAAAVRMDLTNNALGRWLGTQPYPDCEQATWHAYEKRWIQVDPARSPFSSTPRNPPPDPGAFD